MFALSNWRIEQGEPLPADAQIDAEVLRWQDPLTPLSIAQVSDGNRQVYRLRMSSDVAVDVSPNGRIVTHLNAPIPQTTIDHFLADQVIPRLLAHAGSFVFHAGAVRLGGTALVLMGRSGRGKSTLVASFDQAGVALLGDDAMVLSVSNGVPHISPVYPSLRLFPDSIEALIPDKEIAGPIAHYSTKQRIDVEVSGETAVTPLPIKALFSIAAPAGQEAISLRRLSVADACITLVESSFALDPADLDQARRRLDDASTLAGLVPAFEISYPRDYSCLPKVRGAILDQVSALQTARSDDRYP